MIIINIHWGKEYQGKNNQAQQNLAHQIIDTGADLIIGHHSHVVQNIELYNDKLIFYSLGNFIFDQYFSKEVQQSIAIGVEINSSNEIYHLFPINSQLSQPFLMSQQEADLFLADLASKSTANLSEQIKKGTINIRRD